MLNQEFKSAYSDSNFESYVSDTSEISRIGSKYFINDVSETHLQLEDRKSLRSISKSQFDKMANIETDDEWYARVTARTGALEAGIDYEPEVDRGEHL